MTDKFSKESADLILGRQSDGFEFRIKFLCFNIKLSIRYQTGNQVVKISREVAKINSPDLDGEIFAEMMKNAGDIRHKCKIIAIATGSKIPFLSRIIGTCRLSDINKLLVVVREKSDPEAFFLGTKLARGLNQLSRKENSEAAKLS